jgi:uncharacterized protein YgiM (DUF1202 family)
MVFLAACGVLNKPSAKTSPAAKADAKTAAEFSFPQARCGEEASTPSTNWYPVFIDGAELKAIRSQYCGNAVSEVRSKTGAPTVQVASFTSYEKAKKFAEAVGGEVEVVGSAPGSSEAASTRQDSTTGKTATLASAEPGSPINIRQSASIDASVQEVAHSGDAIQVSSKTQGSDGYTWYKVSLESGASGWVRSDLINSAGDSTASRTTTDAAASSTASSTSSTAASTAASTTVSPEASPTASPEASTIASAPPTSTRSAASSSTTTSTASSGRSATIASKDSDSPINVRSGAGTDAEVQDIAYGGDRIQITETKQGDDGQTWYKVQFESGSSGWVRSDFIEN